MVENGLYKVKDKYYSDFPHEKHIHNKRGRPFYYAFKDSRGIYWLIPLSSQVDAYRRKIEDVEKRRGKGNCLTFHIGLIAGAERVFRICNMIPVTDEYIAGEFVFDGLHYIVKDKNLIREISEKSRNYIKQLELGRMTSQVDALGIRKKLLS
ncbi:MAG: hypothetical protein LBI19_02860 [Oscillospiraceae bacterium]|jgi:hypothetical protein|nr:hypothetical protein [Oscillospiraceae bacterium]